jgi:ketosteroid isomerase-like protein
MSAKNKELVKKINEALSKGDFEFVSAHLADNVRWNIVGMPIVSGKNDFLETMKSIIIEDFSAIAINNIIAEGDYVVVESRCNANAKTKESYNPSCCDIYHLTNGKIQDLTTYIVDITLNE